MATATPSHAAKIPPNDAPYADRAYPKPGSGLARDLQTALFAHRCYGNQLTNAEVDGKFGNRSKNALWLFMKTFNDKFAKNFPIAFGSGSNVLAALRNPLLGENACLGSDHFEEWFPDQNEHIPGVQGVVIKKVAPKDLPFANRAYPAPYSPLAKNLQEALFDHKCYGNQLTNSEIDQKFEDRSRRALWVFMDTFNDRFSRNNTSIRISSAENALAILKNERINSTFCGNSPRLSEWFPDYNEHIDQAALANAALSSGGTCNKEAVGADFLNSRAPQVISVARLRQQIDLVINNFDQIFREGEVDFTAGFDDKALERLEKYGKPGVTNETTLRALKEASHQFSRLSFAYGVKTKKDCEVCYRINDWIYLRNIAQANGGYLIGKQPAPAVSFVTFPVDGLTEKMMSYIELNLKIYRAITAKMQELIATAKPISDKPVSDKVGADKTGGVDQQVEVNKFREFEMLTIVTGLASIQNDKDYAWNPRTNPYMRAVAGLYQCIGFDGSSVDQ